MPQPPKVQRPLSRTTRSGKVAPSKFTPSHAFQGSKTHPAVKQSQELPMPSGAPTGSFAPSPAPDLLSSIPEFSSASPAQGLMGGPEMPGAPGAGGAPGGLPQPGMPPNPLDALSGPPKPGLTDQIPGGKTLMQPTTSWLSQNRFIPNSVASQRANAGVSAGKPPAGPRAPIPLGPVPGPVGPPPSPGGPEGGAAAVLAKQGKAKTPFEFGQTVNVPALKQSAAFNFGSDISKHIKPKAKTTTRTESTHRGADIKRGLSSAV